MPNYTYQDEQVIITLPNADYVISSDGQKLLSAQSAIELEGEIKRLQKEFLAKEASEKFITAGQASEILAITKQAFSKNKRIQRGMIYHIEIGNTKLYHIDSVLKFKEDKDGRFSIKDFCLSNQENLSASEGFSELSEQDQRQIKHVIKLLKETPALAHTLLSEARIQD